MLLRLGTLRDPVAPIAPRSIAPPWGVVRWTRVASPPRRAGTPGLVACPQRGQTQGRLGIRLLSLAAPARQDRLGCRPPQPQAQRGDKVAGYNKTTCFETICFETIYFETICFETICFETICFETSASRPSASRSNSLASLDRRQTRRWCAVEGSGGSPEWKRRADSDGKSDRPWRLINEHSTFAIHGRRLASLHENDPFSSWAVSLSLGTVARLHCQVHYWALPCHTGVLSSTNQSTNQSINQPITLIERSYTLRLCPERTG